MAGGPKPMQTRAGDTIDQADTGERRSPLNRSVIHADC